MNDSNLLKDDWGATHRADTLNLGLWTAAWLVTLAITVFGAALLWDYAVVPTAAALALNLASGVGMIFANRRYLRGLDELHRKIFLDASALTLGVGLVFGLAYEMLDEIRLVSFQPEFSHIVVLMSLTFLIGTIMGHRKYQ